MTFFLFFLTWIKWEWACAKITGNQWVTIIINNKIVQLCCSDIGLVSYSESILGLLPGSRSRRMAQGVWAFFPPPSNLNTSIFCEDTSSLVNWTWQLHTWDHLKYSTLTIAQNTLNDSNPFCRNVPVTSKLQHPPRQTPGIWLCIVPRGGGRGNLRVTWEGWGIWTGFISCSGVH